MAKKTKKAEIKKKFPITGNGHRAPEEPTPKFITNVTMNFDVYHSGKIPKEYPKDFLPLLHWLLGRGVYDILPEYKSFDIKKVEVKTRKY